MEFLHLEYFCAVAQTGSITKAAEHLHISQSSLSQTILKLEKDLQTTLFIRIPRGIRLTEAGASFRKYAVSALDQRDAAVKRVQDIDKGPWGEIHVSSNAMSHITARLFFEFKELYPATSIIFMPERTFDGENYSNIFKNIDLLMTTDRHIPMLANSHHLLAVEELLVAMPAGHRLCLRESIPMGELAKEELLLLREGELRDLSLNQCEKAGFTPNISIECKNTGALMNIIAGGTGISFFPKSWKRMLNDSIVMIPVAEGFSREIKMMWDNEKYMSKAACSFKTYVIENFEKHLRGDE